MHYRDSINQIKQLSALNTKLFTNKIAAYEKLIEDKDQKIALLRKEKLRGMVTPVRSE